MKRYRVAPLTGLVVLVVVLGGCSSADDQSRTYAADAILAQVEIVESGSSALTEHSATVATPDDLIDSAVVTQLAITPAQRLTVSPGSERIAFELNADDQQFILDFYVEGRGAVNQGLISSSYLMYACGRLTTVANGTNVRTADLACPDWLRALHDDGHEVSISELVESRG